MPARPNLDVAGSRDDPHAQARRARQQPLLLHSMSVFREIFEIVFAHRAISTVVEVGVESGQVSGIYAELGASTVYCVDPAPSDQLRATLTANPTLQLVETPSPQVLSELPVGELYVLDGDHNYAVLAAELDWIMAHAPDAAIVLHDVLWPWARRDLYYQPSRLDPDQRHPDSADGPTVWHDDLTPAGFVGAGAFTTARHAGGDANGVLTAVEDALSHHQDDGWHLELVPAIFGMGIVYRRASPAAAELTAALGPYSNSRLLHAMENNRIALYTRVLQMQYEAAAHANDADQLANTVAAQQKHIARLQAQLSAAGIDTDSAAPGATSTSA
ncbi:class I SAM-dependent methyltransferase [Actinocrispum wychmicini]|nr:class I SAM-dependent methyltransferase [Actinocrispum wychmicini]